jgi:hypothetical protein
VVLTMAAWPAQIYNTLEWYTWRIDAIIDSIPVEHRSKVIFVLSWASPHGLVRGKRYDPGVGDGRVFSRLLMYNEVAASKMLAAGVRVIRSAMSAQLSFLDCSKGPAHDNYHPADFLIEPVAYEILDWVSERSVQLTALPKGKAA